MYKHTHYTDIHYVIDHDKPTELIELSVSDN